MAGVAIVARVADRAAPFYLDLDKPPEVLVNEAERILADLGSAPAPADRALRVPSQAEAPSTPQHWPAILLRAGLDPTRARAAAPVATPPVFGDERHAWDAEGASGPIRVEAASLKGTPVWFCVQHSRAPSDSSRSFWATC